MEGTLLSPLGFLPLLNPSSFAADPAGFLPTPRLHQIPTPQLLRESLTSHPKLRVVCMTGWYSFIFQQSSPSASKANPKRSNQKRDDRWRAVPLSLHFIMTEDEATDSSCHQSQPPAPCIDHSSPAAATLCTTPPPAHRTPSSSPPSTFYVWFNWRQSLIYCRSNSNAALAISPRHLNGTVRYKTFIFFLNSDVGKEKRFQGIR